MDLSRKWLHEFVDVSDISDHEYAHEMTMSGSIIEGYLDPGAEITNVVVGKLIEVIPHPNADKLSICTVDVGKTEPVIIVTGAKNVKAGDIVPVALCGSTLPGGIRIEKTNMRGIDSNGMLCSFAELGLTLNNVPGADPDGILILNNGKVDLSLDGISLGDDIRPVMGLDDKIAEFEITPNRPDCLSVIGLARETAAVFHRPLKLRQPVVKSSGGNIEDHLQVEVKSDLCKRYAARIVTDVKIGPSPAWLRERLHASGVRPINNIVDITNYVMLEYGQPMHAFDYACIDGNKIIVRTAAAGETIDTLDSKNRALQEGMLLIADEKKAVGVAGVMGGLNSEITDQTRMIVFESANFSGPSVRRTATALGMRTESSSRFEKGLDPENVIPALQRACELVELLDAGRVIDGMIDCNPVPFEPRTLPLEPEKINALLGTDITKEFMIESLTLLGFDVTGDVVAIPSWRQDVERMVDLAEEVARLYGYDNIPTTLMKGTTTIGVLSDRQKAAKTIELTCRALGYTEIITYSFISPSYYDKIRMPIDSPLRKSLTILNPLGEDTGTMRTVTLPSMLEAIAKNYNNRNERVRLSELAGVFHPTNQKLPHEKKILTLGAFGELEFFDLKGDVEGILESLRISDVRIEKTTNHPSYHPGQCATVYASGKQIGVFGKVHPAVTANYGIDVPVFAAELDFDAMFASIGPDPEYIPLPRFPASSRDMAIVCHMDVPAGSLVDIIRQTCGSLLEHAQIFDVYTGDQVPKGKKSVAIALLFRHPERTLNDAEIDDLFRRSLDELKNRFDASLR